MTTPKRIQLRRTKGWRKPEGAMVVARPSKWGNPFTVEACIDAGITDDEAVARTECVAAFRDWLRNEWFWPYGNDKRDRILADLPVLSGHDLACWCPLDQPCHADVLLDLANRSTP